MPQLGNIARVTTLTQAPPSFDRLNRKHKELKRQGWFDQCPVCGEPVLIHESEEMSSVSGEPMYAHKACVTTADVLYKEYADYK